MQINRYHQSIVSHAILLSCMLCCAKQPSEPHNILIRFKIRSAKQTYNKQKHSTVYLAFWTCFHSKTCLSSALSIYCKASHLNCTFHVQSFECCAIHSILPQSLSLFSFCQCTQQITSLITSRKKTPESTEIHVWFSVIFSMRDFSVEFSNLKSIKCKWWFEHAVVAADLTKSERILDGISLQEHSINYEIRTNLYIDAVWTHAN